jgi:hypothetical protein
MGIRFGQKIHAANLVDVTASASELNIMDGVTDTFTELNVLDGISAGLVAAELSLLDGVTATTAELNYVDVTAAGTVEASKAVIASADKDVSSFRNLSAVSVKAGSSGVAGNYELYPVAAANGKLVMECANQGAAHDITINANAFTQATTVNLPNPGAVAATYLMQSTAAVTLAEADVLDGATAGTQVAGKAVVANSDVNIGVVKATQLHIGATGAETQVTASAAELNFCTGVSSAIQTQINNMVSLKVEDTFDVAFADINGDDGTGILAGQCTLAFNSIIYAVIVEISQGDGGAADTLECHLTTGDTIATTVGEIIADWGITASGDKIYVLATGTALFRTTVANKNISLFVKDVGNDAGANANLVGKMTVLYSTTV